MSRKGECLDYAVTESFSGTLKSRMVDHEAYPTKSIAKQSIFECIEVFYNRQRRHSCLDYVRPVDYERNVHLNKSARYFKGSSDSLIFSDLGSRQVVKLNHFL